MKVSFQEKICKFDKVCDYIPIVSTFTNLIDLVSKAILSVFGSNGTQPKSFHAYLDKKPVGECIALLIPVFGNAYVFSKRTHADEKKAKEAYIERDRKYEKEKAERAEKRQLEEDAEKQANTQVVIQKLKNRTNQYQNLSARLDKFDDRFLDTMSIKNSGHDPLTIIQEFSINTSFDFEGLTRNTNNTPELTEQLKLAQDKKEEVYRKVGKIYEALLRDLECYKKYPDAKGSKAAQSELDTVIYSLEVHFPGINKPTVAATHHPLRAAKMQTIIADMKKWHIERDAFLNARKSNDPKLYLDKVQALTSKLDDLTRFFADQYNFEGLDLIGIYQEPEIIKALNAEMNVLAELEKIIEADLKNPALQKRAQILQKRLAEIKNNAVWKKFKS